MHREWLLRFQRERQLLSAAIWLTCTVQTELALPGVKAKEAVRRKRLLFVGVQSDNIPIKCGNSPHIFDKKYDASYIHATAHNRMTRSERF